MAATSLNAETNRWLTSFSRDSKPGDVHTISFGHPILGGEFTTYKLGPIVAHDQYGPLFDLDEATVAMEWPDREFYPIAQLRSIAKDWTIREFELGGAKYERGAFGNFHKVRAIAA